MKQRTKKSLATLSLALLILLSFTATAQASYDEDPEGEHVSNEIVFEDYANGVGGRANGEEGLAIVDFTTTETLPIDSETTAIPPGPPSNVRGEPGNRSESEP